jgi:FlaA1/EpsC-like NDP-sugar epimerase
LRRSRRGPAAAAEREDRLSRLEGFVRGKSIVVTGGGGSIGAEICDRVVTFGAARCW